VSGDNNLDRLAIRRATIFFSILWALFFPSISITGVFFGPGPIDGITKVFALISVIPLAGVGFAAGYMLLMFLVAPALSLAVRHLPGHKMSAACLVAVSFSLLCIMATSLIDGSTLFHIVGIGFTSLLSSTGLAIQYSKLAPKDT
jgi:hypothetical protein